MDLQAVQAALRPETRGTTFVVPIHIRNPTVRAQNRGIQSVSIELSDLWLCELEKQYPES